MIRHIVLLLLSPLAALVGRLMPDDRDREILALRQQVLILQRQVGKRARLRRAERLALLLACLRMKKQQLLGCLLVVKPATLVGWHRRIVRRHWTFRQRRKPGRPRVGRAAERLVVQIARDNRHWGYTKIAGEVRKLGFPTIGRSTVERIPKRHGLAPRPHHGGLTWADFLGHYGEFIWACDFFTVTTATLRTNYVLFFIEIGTRRIVHCNLSEHADGDWVAQQFRNLSMLRDGLRRYLIHDRDSKFTPYAGSPGERWFPPREVRFVARR
jgi:putative transposase